MEPLNPGSSSADLRGFAERLSLAADAVDAAEKASKEREAAAAAALAAEQSAQAANASARAKIKAIGAPVPVTPPAAPATAMAPASAVTPQASPPAPPVPPTIVVQPAPTPPGGIVHQVIGWVAFALAIVAIFLFLFKTKDGEPVALSLFNTMSARINGQDARIDKVATDSSTALAVANSTAKRVDVLEPAVRLAQNTANEAKVIAIAASAASAKCNRCGGGASGASGGKTSGHHAVAPSSKSFAVAKARVTGNRLLNFCGIEAVDGAGKVIAFFLLNEDKEKKPGQLHVVKYDMVGGTIQQAGYYPIILPTTCRGVQDKVEAAWNKVTADFGIHNCTPRST